jgi:hypothetical protein
MKAIDQGHKSPRLTKQECKVLQAAGKICERLRAA